MHADNYGNWPQMWCGSIFTHAICEACAKDTEALIGQFMDTGQSGVAANFLSPHLPTLPTQHCTNQVGRTLSFAHALVPLDDRSLLMERRVVPKFVIAGTPGKLGGELNAFFKGTACDTYLVRIFLSYILNYLFLERVYDEKCSLFLC